MGQEPAVTSLLNRAAPLDYVREWEDALGREKGDLKDASEGAIVIFRLASEHLALSSLVVGQITTMRTVHRVPHLKSPYVSGVVNINGRLRLFFSLESLLDMGDGRGARADEGVRERLVAPLILIEHEGEVWTFAAQEVLGVFHADLTHLKNVPVTVAKSTANYVKGVLPWREKQVGLLDEALLCFSLRRSL